METAGPFSPGIVVSDWEIGSAKGYLGENRPVCGAAFGSWDGSHDNQHSSKSLAFGPQSSASSPISEIAWH